MEFCKVKYKDESEKMQKCFGKLRRIRKLSWRKGYRFCLECFKRNQKD